MPKTGLVGLPAVLVRGAYIQRATSDKMSVEKDAMERYLSEVVPTKRPTSQVADRKRSRVLIHFSRCFVLTALTPEVIADLEILGWRAKSLGRCWETQAKERTTLFVLTLRFLVTC